jgi:hypothetical protein
MSVLGIDSGEITGYPEVMPRSKLSATRARSRLLGSRTSGLWACHGQLLPNPVKEGLPTNRPASGRESIAGWHAALYLATVY